MVETTNWKDILMSPTIDKDKYIEELRQRIIKDHEGFIKCGEYINALITQINSITCEIIEWPDKWKKFQEEITK